MTDDRRQPSAADASQVSPSPVTTSLDPERARTSSLRPFWGHMLGRDGR